MCAEMFQRLSVSKDVPRDDCSDIQSKECIAAQRNEYIPEVEAYPIHQPVHMGENKEIPWKEMKAYCWVRYRIWDPGIANINVR